MGHIDTENLLVEKEKELKEMLNPHNTLEQEKLHIQREILNLQIKKKDLEIVIDKSKSIIKQKELEIRLLTKKFWAEKNSGE